LPENPASVPDFPLGVCAATLCVAFRKLRPSGVAGGIG
jgi:hypothetical protein